MSWLHGIAKRLGGEVIGRNQVSCPGPGHGRDDRSLVVWFESEVKFRVHSHANDAWQECRDHVTGLLGIRDAKAERKAVARVKEDKSNSDFAARLWDESIDPRGTPAERYLARRGIMLPATTAWRAIRYHRDCPFGVGRRGPCMVARYTPIRGDDSAPVTAIHRTLLDPSTPTGHAGKKMLGDVRGQVIKLDADEDVTMGLALGEGIESTLAFRQIMADPWAPVWAAGTAGSIARFPVLPGIDALTVAIDHDASKAGQEAAIEAGDRWRAAEQDFYWHMPVELGDDFADLPKRIAAGSRIEDLVLSYG